MTSMRGSLSEAPWTLSLYRVTWTLSSLLGPLSGSGIMPPISPRIHSGGIKLPTYVTPMAQRRRIGHEPNEITLELAKLKADGPRDYAGGHETVPLGQTRAGRNFC